MCTSGNNRYFGAFGEINNDFGGSFKFPMEVFIFLSCDVLLGTVLLQVVRLQSNRLLPANPDVLDDVENLVQLSFINEPSILHTLRRRYGIGKSYVSLKPLQNS